MIFSFGELYNALNEKFNFVKNNPSFCKKYRIIANIFTNLTITKFYNYSVNKKKAFYFYDIIINNESE